MAFSQSFDFGNSTFMELEKGIQAAGKENTHAGNPNIQGAAVSKDSKTPSQDNYSDFFRDEFSYEINQAKKPLEQSMINVSQIQDRLEVASHTDSDLSTSSAFDAQICTEDVFDMEEKSKEAAQELPSLDESSFLCPAQDPEASQQLKEDILRSRCVLAKQNVYHEISQVTQNLSSMSPNQLRVSPNSSRVRDAVPKITDAPPDLESHKSIASWNLPFSIQEEYKKKGVVQMFDWQVECLCKPRVLFEHCNLVYSAPTSAGKTLVSEILLLKTVLERGKKVLVILPFISVVREKMFYLQDLLTPAGYRVEGFFGGYTPPGGFESLNVAICTIEKANSIVNKLLEQGKLDTIGTVVVDEVHLISDKGRGYILELLLAKILYMSRRNALQIQVITMSATLENVDLLKTWLDAELYITNYRPVALQEMIKVGTKIFDQQLKFLRDLSQQKEMRQALGNDSDDVALLCIETLLEGCSVIVFCPSKDWCENLSVQLATAMHVLIKSGSELGRRLRANLNPTAIEEVKQQLRDIPTGLDGVMSKAVTYACAFHHAGLTTEERDIVEAAFKAGSLKVLVATSTLSSGVNLPARRVLIRSPMFGGKQMSSLTYRQMIGRAGRTGKDTLGESILICTESNARIGRDLVTAQLQPITSCLEMDGSTHLKRALLEVISSGVASTKQDIDCFVNCTLLSAQKALEEKEQPPEEDSDSHYINDALDFLVEYEFVRLQTNEEMDTTAYVATRLGAACLASSMPPTDGLILFAELQKSRRCFVLESELHAVYLVTPYSVCYQLQDLDWLIYLDMWEKLNPAMKKVGELVGVKEAFLVKAMRGQTKLDYKQMQIHKRFYTALALQELVNETPINVVVHKFKCHRGMLQGLQQMASTFAGIVTAFCNSLQWSTLALIVSQFKDRLYFGIHRDLIDLMRLPDLSQKRARALFDAGFTSLVELAGADVLELEKVLFNSLSFDSAKQLDHENAEEAAKRNMIRNFFITGKAGMTVGEAAKLFIGEARQFVQHEIGVGSIKWTQTQIDTNESPKSTSKNEDVDIHMSLEEEHLQIQQPPKRKLSSEEKHGFGSASTHKIPKLEPLGNKLNNPQKKSLVGYLNTNENISKQRDKTVLSPSLIQKNFEQKLQTFDNGEKIESGVKNSSEKPLQHIEKRNQDRVKKGSAVEVKDSLPVDKGKAKVSIPPSFSNENRIQPTAINFKEKSPEKIQRQTSKVDKDTSPKVKSPNEEKPSTSHTARKEMLRKEIAERRRIALMKIQQKRTEMENQSKDPPIQAIRSTPSSLEHTPIELNNAQTSPKTQGTPQHPKSGNTQQKGFYPQQSTNSEAIQNSFHSSRESSATPARGNNKVSSPQLPRRSPRNHVQSPTPTPNRTTSRKTSTAEQDLFMADDSFMLNTGLTAALTAAEGKEPVSSETDEIPSSQPKEPEVSCALTPHASRLMRSYQLRSQRLQSPSSRSPSRSTVTKTLPNESKTEFDSKGGSNVASSMEISDISMENSLMKNPLQLNASHILSCSKADENASSFSSIDIIDVCGNRQLFQGALMELLEAPRCGFSVGLQAQAGRQKPLIGANLLINQVAAAEQREAAADKQVLFQVDDSNFISCLSFSLADNIVYYINMQDEGSAKVQGVPTSLKVQELCKLMARKDLTLLMHDGKEQLKILLRAIPQLQKISAKLEDPKVANWLLQPDRTMSYHNMCQQFAPECTALADLCGSGRGYSSYGLDSSSAILPKIRSSIEACVTAHILNGQIENLGRIGTGQLLKFFTDVEMPIQMTLCHMEFVGFPVNEQRLQRVCQQMSASMKKLESKIYEQHGSRFNLGSTQAVGKVLGLNRKPNGRVTTSRQVLEKLDSPISILILGHRKLGGLLAKSIQPLLKCCSANRIHGQSISYTATGRISMTEPNLQNVAKDFAIQVGSNALNISCRSAFAPNDETRCLLSADFCQLEMRILAHLSQDKALVEVMNSPQDLFIAIAAHWNRIDESQVSEQLRNGTKEICYGIVYGMGIRSLAESLKCNEQEARMISEQFHQAYKGIREYTQKVVKFARNNGYVETITGRRRYLDHVNSAEEQLKNQAERQAINSTIQGSAADIAKSAMLKMEKNIERYRDKLGLGDRPVDLVMHLHDELIFEVPADKARKIAKVLSLTMENCVKLSVPLRVKLRIGRSWGELQEIRV
ncbi:LOW QUALITY PROTEIN: DNA polymerase theta [Drosophila eugracilis]|uniref:LOW QUALITY PROTEIN: DNA polymerase theta n=1 Tax=Drosophila eugracilis TaxID=29029 RepID=UPI001BD97205|nr:LOW QUALITY PROTEIN: DNA polymerase theta [Drosophila eugracilis]